MPVLIGETVRKSMSVLALVTLAACGGGGSGAGSAPAPNPAASATGTTPQSKLVTPQFVIDVPTGTSSSKARSPQRVSPATSSVTITLTNPPAGLTPTSVTTPITLPCPCTVNGPPAPPAVADNFTVSTFASNNGSGSALDTGSTTSTPATGGNDIITIVLGGIPATVTISGVPATFAADTPNQTQALTVTVNDAASYPITTGTYANPVDISLSDSGSHGTSLSGTTTCSAGTSCIVLAGPSSTATLTYGGLAENPVTIAASGTGLTSAGTVTFTPVLHAITSVAGNPTTTYTGGGTGIDLYTTNNASTAGYSGTVNYTEAGFTDAPYSQTLSLASGASCGTFATVAAGANASNETPFTATAIVSPVNGVCTETVTDGLTDQTNALPTFEVTYTSTSVGATGKKRSH